MRDRLSIDLGLASVVVDKTTVVLGQTIFVAAGLVLALTALEPSRDLAIAMAVLLMVQTAGVVGFTWAQFRGGVRGIARILERLGLGGAERFQDLLRRVDSRLLDLYRRRRARVLVSALLHAGAWAVGGLEIYVVLRLAGIPIDLTTAIVLEAVGAAVRFVSFAIPGSLGALEGGNVAAFAALGLPGAAGLSFSLIRRLREATWAVLGLIVLAAFKARPGSVTADGDA